MAVNVEKHIAHWRSGAEEDFAVARATVASGHLRHGLFWAQRAVKKLLMACVTRATTNAAPSRTSLSALAASAGLPLSDEQGKLLTGLDPFFLEGRYPEPDGLVLEKKSVEMDIVRVEEFLEWLKNR